jgi:hypothetical protein
VEEADAAKRRSKLVSGTFEQSTHQGTDEDSQIAGNGKVTKGCGLRLLGAIL